MGALHGDRHVDDGQTGERSLRDVNRHGASLHAIRCACWHGRPEMAEVS
jgi:hypothetical protein